MIRNACLLLSSSVFLGASMSSSFAQLTQIRVLDEHNTGVHSRVRYTEGKSSVVLGDTNQKGVLILNHPCKQGQLLIAAPFDTVAYFESIGIPCTERLERFTLRVITRRSAKGAAVQFRTEPIKLPDGSQGVILYKAIVLTTSSDTPDVEVTVTAARRG